MRGVLAASAIMVATILPAFSAAKAHRSPTTPSPVSVLPPGISEEEMKIPENLSFPDKIKKHLNIINKTLKIRDWAQQKRRELASDPNAKAADLNNYWNEYDNAQKILVPYSIANEQAGSLEAQNYAIDVVKGQICINGQQCKPVDPMVGAMMTVHLAQKPRSASQTQQRTETGTSNACGKNLKVKINGYDICPLVTVLSYKPLDTLTFGILPGVRDLIIPETDRGEIALLIRDPIKRTVEIIQNLRDSVVSRNDHSEGAKFLRDPIKCSIGHLWGACKQ